MEKKIEKLPSNLLKKDEKLFPRGAKLDEKKILLPSPKNLKNFINTQQVVKGMDFNKFSKFSSKNFDYELLFKSFKTTGFQSMQLYKAIKTINTMLQLRFKDGKNDKKNVTILLGYTSNMISCGVREVIRYLVEHSLVDGIVTTTGGIEEDFMKCLADTFIGTFTLDGKKMRESGLNRIGNLVVPNDNYLLFEDFLNDILDKCLLEQKKKKFILTPSKLIAMMGRGINHTGSVYYWAWKNKIPVYCPCITDGSVGDMIYMHSFQNPGLVLDLIGDMKKITDQSVNSKKMGIICIGGAMPKFHTSNSAKLYGGADYAIYINTGLQFDGSNSGAPEEVEKENKFVKEKGECVKIHCEASLVVPLIVSNTFVRFQERYFGRKKKRTKKFCGFC